MDKTFLRKPGSDIFEDQRPPDPPAVLATYKPLVDPSMPKMLCGFCLDSERVEVPAAYIIQYTPSHGAKFLTDNVCENCVRRFTNDRNVTEIHRVEAAPHLWPVTR